MYGYTRKNAYDVARATRSLPRSLPAGPRLVIVIPADGLGGWNPITDGQGSLRAIIEAKLAGSPVIQDAYGDNLGGSRLHNLSQQIASGIYASYVRSTRAANTPAGDLRILVGIEIYIVPNSDQLIQIRDMWRFMFEDIPIEDYGRDPPDIPETPETPTDPGAHSGLGETPPTGDDERWSDQGEAYLVRDDDGSGTEIGWREDSGETYPSDGTDNDEAWTDPDYWDDEEDGDESDDDSENSTGDDTEDENGDDTDDESDSDPDEDKGNCVPPWALRFSETIEQLFDSLWVGGDWPDSDSDGDGAPGDAGDDNGPFGDGAYEFSATNGITTRSQIQTVRLSAYDFSIAIQTYWRPI